MTVHIAAASEGPIWQLRLLSCSRFWSGVAAELCLLSCSRSWWEVAVELSICNERTWLLWDVVDIDQETKKSRFPGIWVLFLAFGAWMGASLRYHILFATHEPYNCAFPLSVEPFYALSYVPWCGKCWATIEITDAFYFGGCINKNFSKKFLWKFFFFMRFSRSVANGFVDTFCGVGLQTQLPQAERSTG